MTRAAITEPFENLHDQILDAVGEEGVVAEPQAMARYLAEERGRFVGRAAFVVRPANTAEVAEVVKLCAAAGVGIVPQGGNTSLVGGSIPFEEGDEIVLSLERMTRIRELDADNFTITVEAGVILQQVQEAAAEADRLRAPAGSAATSPATPAACRSCATATCAISCWGWRWCCPTAGSGTA
jgi:FAD/FMN-containing dehydrogenase